jgi:hypothetical protein
MALVILELISAVGGKFCPIGVINQILLQKFGVLFPNHLLRLQEALAR